jgi:hypothetical protein
VAVVVAFEGGFYLASGAATVAAEFIAIVAFFAIAGVNGAISAFSSISFGEFAGITTGGSIALFVVSDFAIAAGAGGTFGFASDVIGGACGPVFDTAACGASIIIFGISVVAGFAVCADAIAACSGNTGFTDVGADISSFDQAFG